MESTLIIIKPDAIKAGHMGHIISMFEEKNMHIQRMRLESLSTPQVIAHYSHLQTLPFFTDLIRYMTSGPVVLMRVTGINVIEKSRRLIGATDPKLAEEGTIRQRFGTSVDRNAIHGSDSIKAAERELNNFHI